MTRINNDDGVILYGEDIMAGNKPPLPSDEEADVPFPNPLFLHLPLKQRCFLIHCTS